MKIRLPPKVDRFSDFAWDCRETEMKIGSPIAAILAQAFLTDIAVIGGGMSSLHTVEECAKNKSVKVTAIFGNNFLEFPMAAAIILADPSEHPKW
eukprot:342931-Amphidinium_carterae.1